MATGLNLKWIAASALLFASWRHSIFTLQPALASSQLEGRLQHSGEGVRRGTQNWRLQELPGSSTDDEVYEVGSEDDTLQQRDHQRAPLVNSKAKVDAETRSFQLHAEGTAAASALHHPRPPFEEMRQERVDEPVSKRDLLVALAGHWPLQEEEPDSEEGALQTLLLGYLLRGVAALNPTSSTSKAKQHKQLTNETRVAGPSSEQSVTTGSSRHEESALHSAPTPLPQFESLLLPHKEALSARPPPKAKRSTNAMDIDPSRLTSALSQGSTERPQQFPPVLVQNTPLNKEGSQMHGDGRSTLLKTLRKPPPTAPKPTRSFGADLAEAAGAFVWAKQTAHPPLRATMPKPSRSSGGAPAVGVSATDLLKQMLSTPARVTLPKHRSSNEELSDDVNPVDAVQQWPSPPPTVTVPMATWSSGADPADAANASDGPKQTAKPSRSFGGGPAVSVSATDSLQQMPSTAARLTLPKRTCSTEEFPDVANPADSVQQWPPRSPTGTLPMATSSSGATLAEAVSASGTPKQVLSPLSSTSGRLLEDDEQTQPASSTPLSPPKGGATTRSPENKVRQQALLLNQALVVRGMTAFTQDYKMLGGLYSNQINVKRQRAADGRREVDDSTSETVSPQPSGATDTYTEQEQADKRNTEEQTPKVASCRTALPKGSKPQRKGGDTVGSETSPTLSSQPWDIFEPDSAFARVAVGREQPVELSPNVASNKNSSADSQTRMKAKLLVEAASLDPNSPLHNVDPEALMQLLESLPPYLRSTLFAGVSGTPDDSLGSAEGSASGAGGQPVDCSAHPSLYTPGPVQSEAREKKNKFFSLAALRGGNKVPPDPRLDSDISQEGPNCDSNIWCRRAKKNMSKPPQEGGNAFRLTLRRRTKNSKSTQPQTDSDRGTSNEDVLQSGEDFSYPSEPADLFLPNDIPFHEHRSVAPPEGFQVGPAEDAVLLTALDVHKSIPGVEDQCFTRECVTSNQDPTVLGYYTALSQYHGQEQLANSQTRTAEHSLYPLDASISGGEDGENPDSLADSSEAPTRVVSVTSSYTSSEDFPEEHSPTSNIAGGHVIRGSGGSKSRPKASQESFLRKLFRRRSKRQTRPGQTTITLRRGSNTDSDGEEYDV